jgi:threonine dehydratase
MRKFWCLLLVCAWHGSSVILMNVTTSICCHKNSRVVLEPAGALAVAGMKKYVEENEITGQTLVAVTSGANMDFDRLRFVAERADASERTLAVTIPERPGSFRALYSLVWPRNVTEFSYRFEAEGQAHVFISFQPVSNVEHDFEHTLASLREAGFACIDLSDNELAKVHVRHLAGGRSAVPDERLFRFDFPESPGALQRFLQSLDMEWNVSLFHYRNHGDDFGRVLVGLQVPDAARGNMQTFLTNLGYRYQEETDNPVYQTFLRHTQQHPTIPAPKK